MFLLVFLHPNISNDFTTYDETETPILSKILELSWAKYIMRHTFQTSMAMIKNS